MWRGQTWWVCAVSALWLAGPWVLAEQTEKPKAPRPPAVGEAAPDVEFTTLEGTKLQLSKLTEEGPVVLAVLRGFPGYQCPVCHAQVGQFLGKAEEFQQAHARVIFVYPGVAPDLAEKAREFLKERKLPEHMSLALDPEYTFTKAYGLRWEALRETAYPSTFVIAPGGRVTFAKISRTHGNRAQAAEVLQALQRGT